MKNGITLHLVTLTLLVSNRAWAQVTLDGTLGRAGTLPGPDYQIGADVGQQHGGNLFHSFQDFNLQSHESATFSGPDNVQNVISRVTGGNPSSIDGTLRSTIPNADLYFLNPYGIMFGPNAKLDVQGGFHASTADYLRLQDGGRFEARTPGNSLLTVAPVAAFGFLTDTPAPLTTQDSQLAVPKGKTFSWIGGGLEFQGNTPPDYDIHSEILTSHGSSWLLAESGRLQLASVASRGEVIPTAEGLDLTATTSGGPIRATNTELGVSDEEGGGNIFIRGGRFEMTRSLINGQTVNQAGGVTDIQVANLTLQDQTVIETNTFGTAPGGLLNLQVTEELSLTNGGIWSNSHGTMPEAGNAGNVKVQARQVNLVEGAQISSSTVGSGQGGTVHLEVAETLTVTGANAEGYSSSVLAGSYNKELAKAGNAGDVIIQARQVNLAEGAQIGSVTFGAGRGGTVHLEVAETLTVTGANATDSPSGVFASSYNEELAQAGNAGEVFIQARQVNLVDGSQILGSTFGAGQGGNISIRARQLGLTDGAQIASATFGTGQGGTVHLQVAEALTATGVDANGYPSAVAASSENEELANAGAAGNLQIEARQVVLTDGGKLTSGTVGTGPGGNLSLQVEDTLTIAGRAVNGKQSSVVASSRGTLENAGPAGLLNIQAKTINILKDGEISTQSENAGGGDITIVSPNLLYLQQGQLTTSVKGGKDNGGNITINNPVFVILASAKIVAQADEGKGGNIMIRANQFIATPPPDSLVSASSRLGIDGQVVISSPDPNISGKLFLVSTKGLDVTNQLKRPCGSAKSLEEIMNPRFKFYVYPIAGSRQSFEDWGPSPLPSRSASSSSQVKTGKGSAPGRGKPTTETVAQTEYQPVALVVECPKAETVGK